MRRQFDREDWGCILHKHRIELMAPFTSFHSGVQLGVKVYNLVGSTSKRTSVVFLASL